MKINSKAYPLPIDNIDTDQIIPAEFLKQIDKAGYGKNLFFNWRYKNGYENNPDFVLNDERRQGAKVLIAGNNFGCGSSREHAAWAIADYGIQAIVSTQFADIFNGNAYNNGILPIVLRDERVKALLEITATAPATEIAIDLKNQVISCEVLGLKEIFEIHPFKKQCLMEGVDETEYLINLRKEISEFEQTRQLIS